MKKKKLQSFLLILTILCLHQKASLGIAHYFPNISSLPLSQLPNLTGSKWANFKNLSGCHHGDTSVTGLASLKSYMFHFGYITNSSAEEFTDDFDDSLFQALQTYQLNFNLTPTGEVDPDTLSQIQQPRCGNADLVNGTNFMNRDKNGSDPGTNRFKTVEHYSFFPNSPRWPEDRRDLTYAFLPANQLTENAKDVFLRAFDVWAKVIPVTFTRIETYSDADIRIGFFTTDHGDGEPFDGVLGTLAHAFSPPNGRFHLDGDEYWVDGAANGTAAGAFDLESVAVHEIGHLLGLGHSAVKGAIMYPSISAGVRRVELAADDVEGVQVLYGRRVDVVNGSTTLDGGQGQQRETSGGDGRRWRTRGVDLVVTGLVAVGLGLCLI